MGRGSISSRFSDAASAAAAAQGGRGGSAHREQNRRSSHGERRSQRGDVSAMGIDTLSKELAQLAADMERDIGKVYRKYERLERTIRAERDRKIAALR